MKLREGSLTALPPTASVGEAPACAVAHRLGGNLLVCQLEELDGLHVRVAAEKKVKGEVKRSKQKVKVRIKLKAKEKTFD